MADRNEKGQFEEGNKFAEKWTLEKAIEFVESVLDYIETNPKQYHLGKCLIECGGYPNVWSYIC